MNRKSTSDDIISNNNNNNNNGAIHFSHRDVIENRHINGHQLQYNHDVMPTAQAVDKPLNLEMASRTTEKQRTTSAFVKTTSGEQDQQDSVVG